MCGTERKKLQHSKKKIKLSETNALLAISGGDARKLLNIFEIIIGTFGDQQKIEITNELISYWFKIFGTIIGII